MADRPTVDIPIALERNAGTPLSNQLISILRTAMRDGRLRAGERLPSSRALAVTLGVSRTVVTDAYQQLYAEGWLDGRHGSGTYVADVTPVLPAPGTGRSAVPAPRVRIDLRPGTPWMRALETPAWRRAWRLAADEPITPAAGKPGAGLAASRDPHGLPGLRRELAGYLRRSRGVTCTPDQVMVTRGATNGLDLLAATVLRPGDRVGVEEPGYPAARRILAARGATVVPCPVDDHGLIVEDLPADLRLIFTTPSHQYPLGARLTVPRRQALLAWARRRGALVAEDDYDGEFRYDVAPMPALYDLDPGVTVYLGTTAKTLAPDVGVGWLVAGTAMIERIAKRRDDVNDRTAVVPQHAVRIMLERGDLDRHVRRMRTHYARVRAAAVRELAELSPRGDTAGLHLVVVLPPDVTERVMAEAERHGVALTDLGRHWAGAPAITGLVIGYGAATPRDVTTGCALVRRLVHEAVRAAGT